MAIVKFKAGLSKNLPVIRDTNTLYFTTDTRQLYKGNDLFNESIRILSSEPDTPVAGVLYLINGIAKTYTGSEWATVSYPCTSFVNDSSTSQEVPTALAVNRAINDAINTALNSETFNGINTIVSTEAGTITVTKGSTDESIKLAGVVTNPTYDSTTRTIKLPYNKVVDGEVVKDTLVISLGADMVVSGGYYDKENKKIILELTGGGNNIEIPVTDLVQTISVANTNSISMGMNGNEITANVKVSADSSNAVSIKSDGIFVPDLSGDINTINNNISTINETLLTVTGDENINGSIKNAIKVAKDYADTISLRGLTWESFEVQ